MWLLLKNLATLLETGLLEIIYVFERKLIKRNDETTLKRYSQFIDD